MARDIKVGLLFLVGWLVLLRPFPSHAQTSGSITINHVVPTEGDENMGLEVFFTVTNETGHPLFRPDIESATIQLLGGNSDPVPVQIADPQTPIFIALLIDTSGSMQDVMVQVRDAAKSAIDNAPATAHFAVISFNESSFPLQDFTNNHIHVKDVIDTLQASNQGTCLYDALYDAVERLDQQINSPDQRRAIILFTDGQDRLIADRPEPCSRHPYSDVISVARPSSPTAAITPIHTIGIYAQSEAELNVGELRNMAAETGAFSAIGNQTDLNSLFQEIIAGLNSQLVARGQVFARQGENQAVLSIKLRNVDSPFTTTFNFLSSRNYDLPPPPVRVLITDLRHDTVTNIYTLSLSVGSAESIAQLIINVWDENGTQAFNDLISPDSPLVELDGANFEGEREYSIRIEAIDKEGNFIQDEEGKTILDEHEFTHRLIPITLPVEFAIEAVTSDFENGLMFIDLNVTEANRVQSYEGLIVDENTGGNIHEFGPKNFVGERIQESLPDAIRLAEVPGSYRVTVYLTTTDEQRSEYTYDDFKPVPPSPPSWPTAALIALRENPVYLAIIAVIILSLLGLLSLRSKQRKQKEPAIVRPPVDKSIIWSGFDSGQLVSNQSVSPDESEFLSALGGKPPAKSTIRLRLRVVQANPPAAQIDKIIESFPFVIGREGCDLNIAGDRRVSRQHVEISVSDNRFFIKDLGGTNGTFLGDKKLQPGIPIPLAQNKIVHLTSQTHLEVEPLQ